MTEPGGTPETHDERDHVPDEHESPTTAQGADGTASAHGDPGHDEHGHGATVLGPVDWRMWAVGVVGVAVALVVAAGFVVATGFAFNA